MGDLDIEAHLIALADEMKKIREDGLNGRGTDVGVVRFHEIVKEIYRYGWDYKVISSATTGDSVEYAVDVILYRPRADMDTETRKIYDEWFKKMNDIKEGP